MSDEQDEQDSPPRNRSLTEQLLRTMLGSPKNMLMTVVIGMVLFHMAEQKWQHSFATADTSTDTQEEAEKPAPSEDSATTPESPAAPAAQAEQAPAAEEKAPATNGTGSKIDDIAKKLDALQEKLNAAPASPAAPAALPEEAKAEIAKTREEIAALQEKIAAQEQMLASLNEQLAQVSALREQMNAVESRASQKLATMTLFNQLRDAATQGKAFKPELDQLLELNKQNPKINAMLMQLLPVAGTGMRSLPDLKTQFTAALNQTLDNGGNTLADNFRKLIRIRKVGEQQGMDDESILARAEVSMQSGDVRATIKTLESLSAPAKNIMLAFNRAAMEYLNTHATLDALQTAMSEQQKTAEPEAAPAEKAEEKEEAKEAPAPEAPESPAAPEAPPAEATPTPSKAAE